ncbi:MAG: hypothetical protein FWE20_04285 [Defluviitaleaceae bacterium]|nr:hypothetical protein [Defluviitaleaceae bacterium]
MRADPKAEVLRYLGHRGQAVEPELLSRIETAMAECRNVARPRRIWRRFTLVRDGSGLLLADAGLILPLNEVGDYLPDARELAVMAVTLGTEIEARIAREQYFDIAYALMLDAAATQLVDEVCNEAGEALCVQTTAEGLYPGSRFSPGYGSLPLELSADLLELLDAQRSIGLSCTDNYALTPRKSVTALIGLFDSAAQAPERDCSRCDMRHNCNYARI